MTTPGILNGDYRADSPSPHGHTLPPEVTDTYQPRTDNANVHCRVLRNGSSEIESLAQVELSAIGPSALGAVRGDSSRP